VGIFPTAWRFAVKTATLVKSITGWSGDARLFKLSEPVPYGYNEPETTTDHVIVSKVKDHLVCETYIFPADEHCVVIAWGELKGSLKGDYSHADCLAVAGFEVVP
jgi:hypothetical protein